MTGNNSVGGATGAAITQHMHFGGLSDTDTEFPEMDPTVFEPFATNIVDSLEVATVKFLNSLNERRLDPESQAAAAAQRATPEMRGARA
jgi:hypothetical protein